MERQLVLTKQGQEFSKIIEDSYVPQQVFNADETGLFLKKIPNRTYIMKEEKGRERVQTYER